jgi:hypothetical protein
MPRYGPGLEVTVYLEQIRLPCPQKKPNLLYPCDWVKANSHHSMRLHAQQIDRNFAITLYEYTHIIYKFKCVLFSTEYLLAGRFQTHVCPEQIFQKRQLQKQRELADSPAERNTQVRHKNTINYELKSPIPIFSLKRSILPQGCEQ